jgi:hypothetical protein
MAVALGFLQPRRGPRVAQPLINLDTLDLLSLASELLPGWGIHRYTCILPTCPCGNKAVDVKQGCWLALGSLALLLIAVPTATLARDVVFTWSPSAMIGADGKFCAPAVKYEVYHERDGGAPQLVATVPETLYTLVDAEPDVVHRICVVGLDADDRPGPPSEWSVPISFTEDGPPEIIPATPLLQPNYPNPFNPLTRIEYNIPATAGGDARVSLEIYNLQGRRVRVLRPESGVGWHVAEWNGTDDSGQILPTGQYILMYRCRSQVMTTKMTMVK